MLSKLIPKRMYGLMYITSNTMEKENRVEYDIKPSDNLMKKHIKQNNNCFNDNILISFDSKIINQIKRPIYQNLSNQYNFKISGAELLKIRLKYFQILKYQINTNDNYLANNDIHLHTELENINYDHIPIVTYYSLLIEALWKDSGNLNNPFNLHKRICSIFDASNLGPAAKEDFKELSRLFYQLFITAVKYKILDMVDEENSIRAIRNSFCHDNYFSMTDADGMNITYIEKLKAVPFLDPQRKLDQLKKDDLVIFAMYEDHNGVNHITFCYIIKNKDFETVAHKFKNMCKQIIVKSKQQPQSDKTKTFNNLKEAQLLRYIRQADKSSPYSPSFRK